MSYNAVSEAYTKPVAGAWPMHKALAIKCVNKICHWWPRCTPLCTLWLSAMHTSRPSGRNDRLRKTAVHKHNVRCGTAEEQLRHSGRSSLAQNTLILGLSSSSLISCSRGTTIKQQLAFIDRTVKFLIVISHFVSVAVP